MATRVALGMVLVVVVAGCRRSDPADDLTACRTRADALAQRLMPLARASLLPVPEKLEPIESERGTPIDAYGPVLALHHDGAVTLSGMPVEAPDQLGGYLQMQREARVADEAVYVIADRRVTRETLEPWLAAVADDVEVRAVVFGPPRAKTDRDRRLEAQPAVKEFLAAADGASPSEAAVVVARAVEDALGTCQPLIRLFGAIAGVSAEDKGRHLTEGLAQALIECECEVRDFDLLEYALLRVLGAYDRPQRWVPVDELPERR